MTNPASCPTTLYNLAPLQAQAVSLTALSFLPDGWTGSVKLQSSNGMPIAVAVTNSNNVGGYNYTATSYAGRTVYLPYAAKGNRRHQHQLHFAQRLRRQHRCAGILLQPRRYELTSTDTFTMVSAQVKAWRSFRTAVSMARQYRAPIHR
ncbi:MAG: hypothetical protein R2873_05695 [Caldilineaceae bacterium]